MAGIRLGRFNMKTLIIAGGLVVALVPALMVAVGSGVAVRNLETTKSLEQNELMARKLADELEDFLAFHVRAMQVFAAHAGVIEGLPAEALSAMAKRTRGSHPAFDRLLVVGLDARSLAADPPVAADGTTSIGLEYGDRVWFREVLRTRRSFVDRNLVIGRAAKRPVISIAVPIFDANQQVKAILVAGVDVARTQEIVSLVQFGKTGHTVVTTGAGITISHENRRLIDEQMDFSRQPIWQMIANANTGRVPAYLAEANEERIAGFATVPSTGWKVWVSQATAELDREIYDTYRSVLVWLVVALLGALGLAFGLGRVLSRPVEALRGTATAVAGGDLDKRAEERGPRDLTELARALNHMAASLQGMVQSERTSKDRLTQAVADYTVLTSRVVSGDLTARIAVSREPEFTQLGDSVNHMIESLARMVSEIRDAATNLVSATTEILAATSQQVSATAEEAASVKQTAATVGEVRQTAELSAQKAKAVAEAAQRATQVAQEGRRSVEESIKGSEDAKTRMEALAERILGFSDQVQAIAEINATVNDLAEQSNLLAVNAGIEAAKAGEAGRGFAVVATEVKALADQCKQATAQVRGILNEIQRATHGAVMAAEQGVKTAEGGVTVAARSGEAIRQLAESVSDSAQIAQQILASTQQQTIGMDQIALAMRNIEQASTQTIAATGQVQHSARDLNELAHRLNKLAATARTGVAAAA